MTEGSNSTSSRVVIVGGGVAGLEALLALRALLGDRSELTLVSDHEWFVDRPVTVAEPFGLGAAARYPLAEIAAEFRAEFVHATVTAVDHAEHRIGLAGGADIGFDTLILAPGARLSSALPGAITFGAEGSGEALTEMLGRMRAGEVRSATFAAPAINGWALPLYELALMTARELAVHDVPGVELRLVTLEDRPLALFGEDGSESVARLLDAAGIQFVGSTVLDDQSGASPPTDHLVTLPRLRGPALAGVPAIQPHEFIPVDEFGRVEGLTDVYAAGDAVTFPIKQGGLAAQLADSVAQHVAARYGASVQPEPFRPVLRGMLFTGGEPRFMRTDMQGAAVGVSDAWYPLWWPPTKVAGRYLGPYLFARGDVEGFGPRPEGFVDVEVPLTAATLPG
jgi:sulfide:quinone oxidoreductase